MTATVWPFRTQWCWLGIYEFLQRWTKDGDRNIPTTIDAKPLPDLDALNADIPETEWPTRRDGKTEPPFKHYCRLLPSSTP